MLRWIPITLLGALALPVPAQTRPDRDAAAIERKLSGLVPGKPQLCISPSATRGNDHSGDVVLFEDRAGVRYLNRFRDGCTARSYDSLITRTPGTQTCSGDIVRVVDLPAHIERGACVLGEFVPYRKPADAAR